MDKWRRVYILIVNILVCLSIVSISKAGTRIHINTGVPKMTGSKLFVNNQFIGLVGDLIFFKDGRHEVFLDIYSKNQYAYKNRPHAYWPPSSPKYQVSFVIDVLGSKVKYVPGTGFKRGDCWSDKKVDVRWPSPSIVKSKKFNGAIEVNLNQPDVRTQLNCSYGSSAGCNEKYVILTANSNPEGAEVWVDDRKVSGATNMVLSVPFCPGEKHKGVLMRLSNTVICRQTILLAPNKKINMTCP